MTSRRIAAASIRGAPGTAEGTGNVTAHPASSCVIGDLVVLVVYTDGTSGQPTVTPSAGSQAITYVGGIDGATVGIHIFYSWANFNSNTDGWVITDTGDHTVGDIYTFDDVNIDTTTPVVILGTNTQASTTAVSISGGALPSDVYCGTILALTAGDGPDANGLNQFSAWANTAAVPRGSTTDTPSITELKDATRAIGTGCAIGTADGFATGVDLGGTVPATTATAVNAAARANATILIKTASREVDRHRAAHHSKYGTTHIGTNYVTPTIVWPDEADNSLLLLFTENAKSTGSPSLGTITGCGITWESVASVALPDAINRMTVWRGMGSPTDGALTANFGTCTNFSINALYIPGVVTGANGANAIRQSKAGSEDHRSGPTDTVISLDFDAAPLNNLPTTLGWNYSSNNSEHALILLEVLAAQGTDQNHVIMFGGTFLAVGAGGGVLSTIPAGGNWIMVPVDANAPGSANANLWCFYEGAVAPGIGWGIVLQ